ncbi:MAG: hypothetical protein HY820_34440 [Acidobacteria bacterium]|nr:hypothetical protein [Acidobacteriota bacterium]
MLFTFVTLVVPGKCAMSINGHSDPDKTPEPVDCVFLWHTLPCREAVRRAATRVLRLYTANSLPQARQLLSEKGARVLLVEAGGNDPGWIGAVSEWGRTEAGACWVPVLMQFDGSKWIDLLERGAFDVVCAPIETPSLQRIVHGADSKARLDGTEARDVSYQFKPQ